MSEREGEHEGSGAEGLREACEVDRRFSGQTVHKTLPPLAEAESAALCRA